MNMLRVLFPSWFKVNYKNSLATLYPDLAIQFHTTKNGNWNPDNVSSEKNSNHKENHKFWWNCSKGDDHIFQSNIRLQIYAKKYSRNQCPMCKGLVIVESNSLIFNYPEVAKQWHPTKNGEFNPENTWYRNDKKIFKCEGRRKKTLR